jgi:peroxiredoxin
MLRVFSIFISLSLLILVQSCTSENKKISEGLWQAKIFREQTPIPFLLDIKASKDKSYYIVHAVNGEERLLMDTAYVENDSIYIPMQLFDSEIVAKAGKDKLEGVWKRYRQGIEIGSLPFTANYNITYRFKAEEKSEASNDISVTGKWNTTFFTADSKDSTKAVGVFEQKGNIVTGSFLTATGDYRYLAGTAIKDSLYLSAFDGSHLYLFRAKIQADGSLNGDFLAGLSGFYTWRAFKDSEARLPDAGSLTYLKPGFETLDFNFPDAEGKMISSKDPRFNDKILIIQIMGSWCPNCMDETNFLSPWIKQNRQRGIEIVGLTYEQSTDLEVTAPKMRKMVERFGIDYPVLLAGSRDKESAASSLPALNHIMSFPTTIIIDKQKKVRHIHTGFNGPGTGHYYDEFVEEFNQLIDKLLAE